MRLWKNKFYREVPCKACEGTGKVKAKWPSETNFGIYVCPSCNGKGTQTVLEREE